MRRYYFLGKDPEQIDGVVKDLLDAGFSDPQIHILNEASSASRGDSHEVQAFDMTDTVHAGLLGALVGLVLAASVLALGALFHLQGAVDWLPLVFIALVLFGFSTWEGGLYGFQVYTKEYRQFRDFLANGYQVLMIDTEKKVRDRISHILAYYPSLEEAGEGKGLPQWVISSQRNFQALVKAMP